MLIFLWIKVNFLQQYTLLKTNSKHKVQYMGEWASAITSTSTTHVQ